MLRTEKYSCTYSLFVPLFLRLFRLLFTIFMSNRTSSRKHGMAGITERRKKSGRRADGGSKTRRQNARAAQIARQEAIASSKAAFVATV